MAKSLWYRLLGLGGIPRRVRPQLEAEGIILVDEGVPGWLVTKRVDGPRTRYRRRAQGFAGSVVVTGARFVCFAFGTRQINVPVGDPKMVALRVAVPKAGTLSVAFEAGAFREGWSGIIDCRYRTALAQPFLDQLLSMGARLEHDDRH